MKEDEKFWRWIDEGIKKRQLKEEIELLVNGIPDDFMEKLCRYMYMKSPISMLPEILSQIMEWNEEERLENIEYAEKYKEDSEFVHSLKSLFRKERATMLYKLFLKIKEEK